MIDWKTRKYEIYHGNWWSTWHNLPEIIGITAAGITASLGMLGFTVWAMVHLFVTR